jgi:hypothetical protein
MERQFKGMSAGSEAQPQAPMLCKISLARDSNPTPSVSEPASPSSRSNYSLLIETVPTFEPEVVRDLFIFARTYAINKRN